MVLLFNIAINFIDSSSVLDISPPKGISVSEKALKILISDCPEGGMSTAEEVYVLGRIREIIAVIIDIVITLLIIDIFLDNNILIISKNVS